MKFFRPLLASLWKTWILHRRHYIVSALEILLPISLSYILVVTYNSAFDKLNLSGEEKKINFTKPIRSIDYNRNGSLLYAPETARTHKLMDLAFKDYILLNVTGINSEKDVNEIITRYKNQKDFLKDNIWGAVIFYHFDGNTIPSILKYKLLTINAEPVKMTNNTGDHDQILERTDVSNYISNGFLSMQSSIDLAYIHLRQKEKGMLTQNIEIFTQAIPLPAFNSIEGVTNILKTIPSTVGYSLIIFCAIAVMRMVDEKSNGAKELMKMMGMSTVVYWITSIISNFIILTIISAVITVIFATKSTGGSIVLANDDSTLFFVIMIMYSLALLLFSFTISTFFRKASMAVTLVTILNILSIFVASQNVSNLNIMLSVKLLSCFIPSMAFNWAITIMIENRKSGISSQWSNIMTPPLHYPDIFCLGIIIVMMAVSSVFYFFLTWYLDVVWPSQPGVPKSPLFCFYPSYWRSQRRKKEDIRALPILGKYFEAEPNGVTPSVIISCLIKSFKIGSTNIKAVDDVSLNMYPGQITALLGHNGAGKTTLMNILTGLLTPDKGTAFINGHDILKETEAARSNLGLCPQHNVLYDDLTVEEHLKLFSGLKGLPWSMMNEEITATLEKLELQHKRHTTSKSLSGGMKRKLSLANAVVGGSQVLILDEPTSGLDPEARKVIWDFLLALRSERTIFLTTHYMEEADLLGDRIAIMSNGSLKCCGSPMFLKKQYDTGYNLRIEKGKDCRPNNITTIIQRHISEAKLLNDANLEMLYSLSSSSECFSALFEELENYNQSLGIESFGIAITTMEDVFMKVSEGKRDVKEKRIQLEDTYGSGSKGLHYSTKPTRRLMQQMEALFMKRYHHAKRNLYLLIFQVLIPLVAFSAFVYISSTQKFKKIEKGQFVSFDVKKEFPNEKYGFYYLEKNTTELVSLGKVYKEILEQQSVKTNRVEDVMEYLLNVSDEGTGSNAEKYLLGGSFNISNKRLSVTSWYNNIHYYLAPTSMNLMTNSLLRYLTNDTNSNIHFTSFDYSLKAETMNEDLIYQLFALLLVPLGLSFLSASFVLFPIHERVSKAKLLQTTCGVRTIVYWLMNLSWDFLVHAMSSLIFLFPFIIYYYNENLPKMEAIGVIYLCLLLYGLSSVLLSYLISFIPKVPSTGFIILVILNSIVGIIITFVMQLLTQLSKLSGLETSIWVFRFLPNYAIARAINSIQVTSQLLIKCQKYPVDKLSNMCSDGSNIFIQRCCEVKKGSFSYLSWEDAGKECFALTLASILWFMLIMSLETFNFNGWNLIKATFCKPKPSNNNGTFSTKVCKDENVSQEEQKIEDLFNRNAINERALVLHNLTKLFGSLCAVKNLTFSVPKEECFGLLGINGAGKTTTFRMLAGELRPTGGNAHIGRYNVKNNVWKFLTFIGYCPQFDALIDQLTAKETLQLYANLRGVAKKDVPYVVNRMIALCDLRENANKPSETYSGGTKRKLSLAMALIGSPPLVLLDEPTSGIDPKSRRRIWETIDAMKKLHRTSFIMTTHSMDECEYLCDRIAIMVNGELCCIGAMQNLKTNFCQGYKLIIKLSQEDSESSDAVVNLEQWIKHYFPSSTLKLQHQGILHYHITEASLKWSTMFSIMERIKQQFKLEDYILSGTTLEQIFMAFAQTQK